MAGTKRESGGRRPARVRPAGGGGISARFAALLIFLAVSAAFYLFRYHGGNSLEALLLPRPNTHTLLWNGIASILVRNAPDKAEAILTAGSCVCGGIAAALLFASMRLLALLSLRLSRIYSWQKKNAAWAAGLVAVASFAFCQPCWIAVGWIRPEMFEAAFAMVVVYLFLAATASGGFAPLAAFSFLYGLLAFENQEMCRFAPFFAIFVVVLLVRTGRASLGHLLSLAALFVLGALFYLVLVDMEIGHPLPLDGSESAVANFMNSTAESLGIRQGQIKIHNTMSATSNYWGALVAHFRQTFLNWPRQPMSMHLAFIVIAPWVASLTLWSWSFDHVPRNSELLLNLVIAATVFIGLSPNPLSPWVAMGPLVKSGRIHELPIIPQAMMASTAGYIAGWGVIRSGGYLLGRMQFMESLDGDASYYEDDYYALLQSKVVFWFARTLVWCLIVLTIATATLNFRPPVRRGEIADPPAADDSSVSGQPSPAALPTAPATTSASK